MGSHISENHNINGWFLIIFILVLVLGLWFLYPWWSYFYKDHFYNTELSEMGVFGDSYGALNTLFSALAFTGIIASIYFQREELKATREELEATRREMKSQGEQFEAQTKALNLQVFENTFFNMLKLYNDIVESMVMRKPNGEELHGRRVFNMLCDKYRRLRYSEGNVIDVIVAYDNFYARHEDAVGNYFRVLYQIIRFVDSSLLKEEEKKVYVNILRAQLSIGETILLCLNCLSQHGRDNHKPLIEKYSILEHISISALKSVLEYESCMQMVITSYDIEAYGNTKAEIHTYLAPY